MVKVYPSSPPQHHTGFRVHHVALIMRSDPPATWRERVPLRKLHPGFTGYHGQMPGSHYAKLFKQCGIL